MSDSLKETEKRCTFSMICRSLLGQKRSGAADEPDSCWYQGGAKDHCWYSAWVAQLFEEKMARNEKFLTLGVRLVCECIVWVT